MRSSFYFEDPIGFGSTFAGLENYSDALGNAEYQRVARFTVWFTALVTFFSLGIALLLAVKADSIIRGARTYRTLLMWVYAIAPPVARPSPTSVATADTSIRFLFFMDSSRSVPVICTGIRTEAVIIW